MFIKKKRGWEIPERDATPEHLFFNRRRFLTVGAAIGAVAALSACEEKQEAQAQANAAPAEADPSASLYPFKRNETYKLDREVTSEEWATTYNNYYEFSSGKNLVDRAQALPVRPWVVDRGRHGRSADADRDRRADEKDAAGRAALPPSLRRDLVDGRARGAALR